jgi:hypothetical protein
MDGRYTGRKHKPEIGTRLALVLEKLLTKDTSPHLKFRCPIKFLHTDELKTVKTPGEAQRLINSSLASG